MLVNSNPATIMTDKDIADKVYIEPLSAPTVEKIIETERPGFYFVYSWRTNRPEFGDGAV